MRKLMTKLNPVFLLILLSFHSASYAYQEKPIPLSREELASFEDALNLFPIKKLPDVGIKFKGFSWLNDNTALAGLDHIGNWTAEHSELSKISTLNIETGQIQETQYRGRLVCYQPERMAVCPDAILNCGFANPENHSPRPITPFLMGKFGEDLVQLDNTSKGKFNLDACNPVFPKVEPNSNVPDNFRLGTLVLGASYIGHSKEFIPAGEPYALFDNNFKMYWQTNLVNGCEWMAPIIFHPWDKSYLIGNNFYRSSAQSSGNCATHHRIFLVQPNVSVQEILVPDLFEGWLKQHIAGINMAMTKKGMLVYSKPASDPNRLGLFWVDSKGAIKRLIADRLVEFLSVAPDGCHVLIQHHELNKVMMGMPATDLERKRIVRTFETSVIDMCK